MNQTFEKNGRAGSGETLMQQLLRIMGVSDHISPAQAGRVDAERAFQSAKSAVETENEEKAPN